MVPSTWHYGLVAQWWAEFNSDGPEIEYFRRFVEAGQPALDVGCGTGRLLLPYVRAGLDVDGCDVSADMIAHCREAAARDGLSPNLHAQAMHELDLPRRYRTIFVCGALGLGSSREQDREGFRRLYEHLEPGGTLVVDNEVPYADAALWQYWLKEKRAELKERRAELKERRAEPRPLPEPGDRRFASDGSELALQGRLLDFDPLAQQATRQLRAFRWRDGELVEEEEHLLTTTLYFKDEIVLMLERAGFEDVTVLGQHNDEPPTPDDDFLVFVARRPRQAL